MENNPFDYLTKGSLVYIEGKLKTGNYEDKEGMKRYVTEVVADQLIMLEKKRVLMNACYGLNGFKASHIADTCTLGGIL